MNKLEKLKEAFKEVDFPLSQLAHYSWCTLELGKSYKPSIEMLDVLYCGLVSGVIGNLGSGKIPEYIENQK